MPHLAPFSTEDTERPRSNVPGGLAIAGAFGAFSAWSSHAFAGFIAAGVGVSIVGVVWWLVRRWRTE